MISELNPEDLPHIKYTTTWASFKDCPQWFLIWVDKLKFVFAGLAVVYIGSAFLFDKVFNMHWLIDHQVIATILIAITVGSFYMGVHTNVGNMRQKEFNKYNDDNIFWSPMDLDYATREYFNIPDVISAITSTDLNITVNNVLAFRDSRLSTGDVEYDTREYNSSDSLGSAYKYVSHSCPYSASPIDTNLPSMKLFRKKLDYTHLYRLNAIKMPDGSLADWVIKKTRRGSDDNDTIVGALQKNDLGVEIEKWFSRYPEVNAVDIFPNMFVIYWGSEIPGDFNSVKALPEKVISQYEMRLAGTLDLKSILEV